MLAVEVLLALAALVVLPLLAITVRRRVLMRSGGMVEMSLRARRARHGRGWVLGLGRFAGDELLWYRVFSLAPGPRRRLPRGELTVRSSRTPVGGEALALLKGAVVLECGCPDGGVELAMDRSALTGFLAWLEAQPPGATLPGSR